MNIKKLTLNSTEFPEVLRQIPAAPKQLFVAGAPLVEILKRPRLAIVGSRKFSTYGDKVTTDLARQLAEQGILIISGLAFGIDALAHRAALEVGGLCIAVLPSPLDKIVPTNNYRLAERILEEGGALVSEYAPGEPPFKQNFVARNRLMAGLAEAVLITEAGEKSGALYTANYANDQGKEVLAVPGRVDSSYSVGCNNLIKSAKAAAVTNYIDVLHALKLEDHLTPAKQVRGRNRQEQTILDLLLQGVFEGDKLLAQSGLNVSEFNRVLTMLEIGGKIRPLGANNWAIY